MGNYPRAIVPYTRLSPPACTALAVAIDDAIEIFMQWQLPTGVATRLRRAADHLRFVASQNSYGTTPTELRTTANAIRLASDFYLISRTLRGVRDDPIARELAIALGGTLDGATRNQSAYDMQSQFWFGTVLAHSNLHPAVPDISGRKPDFVISVDGLNCCVEVKRPQSTASAERALSAAATQLREINRPIIIVLDLSQCIDADKFILHENVMPARQMLHQQFSILADQLSNIPHNYLRSNKYDHVISLVVFARFFSWTLGRTEDADNGFFFSITTFPKAYRGLLISQVERFQRLISQGFARISGNPVRATYH